MSTNINIEPQTVCTEVIPEESLVSTNTHEITPVETTSTVEGFKKEYSVVGDGLYASVSVEDAPLWLTGLIDNVVASAVASGMVDYDLLVQDVRNAVDSIDVAKNTYVEQVNVDTIVNGIITTRLQTLNATVDNNSASIVDLDTTVATLDSTLSQRITDIESSFNEDVDARITQALTTYSDDSKASANSVEVLTAAFNDQNSELAANAVAVSGLQTYVGLTGSGDPNGTGILASISTLQKQNDGTVETYAGTHAIKIIDTDDTDGVDTNELLIDQWPYALWTPMEGTVDPTMTTRVAFKGTDSASYDIEPHTVYKNTANNTFWEYHPVTYGGWEEITETEYLNNLENVRALHTGDTYILFEYSEGQKQYVASYRFYKNSIDTTSPYETDTAGYSWAVITDTAAQDAYIKALNAYDLADGKVSQYYAWYHPDGTLPYNVTMNEGTPDEYQILGSSFRHMLKNGALFTLEEDHDPSDLFVTSLDSVVAGTDSSSDFYTWGMTTAPDGFAYFDVDKSGTVTSADSAGFSGIIDGTYTLINDPLGVYERWEDVIRPSLLVQSWDITGLMQEGWDINNNPSSGDILNAYNPVIRDYTLYTYNGTTWVRSGPEGIISQSQFVIDLENDVTGPTGHVATSLSALKAESEAYADAEGARVENKFAYDSTVILNGDHYYAGFGLNSTGVTQPEGADGTVGNEFDSEFWVNAERFVLKSPTHGTTATFDVTQSGIVLGVEHTEATRNEPKGTYVAATTYEKGDIVSYSGSSYTALQTTLGNLPTNTTYWQLLSEKGDTAAVVDNGDGTYTVTGENGSITISDGTPAPIPTVTDNNDGTYTVNDGSGNTVVVSDGDTPIKGIDYFDGSSGNFVSFIYKTGVSVSAPTGGTFNGTTETYPTGWTDTPSASTDDIEWVSKTTYTESTTYDAQGNPTTTWANNGWSTPTKFYQRGEAGVSYTGTQEYYKLTNTTTAPVIDTSWSTTPQTPTSSNKYLWNYNKNSKSDGTSTNSSVSLITQYVEDGKGISSITEQYAINNSATTAPTTWSSTMSSPTNTDKYLWNKTTIAYTDGSTADTTTIIAVKGDDGVSGSANTHLGLVITSNLTLDPTENKVSKTADNSSWNGELKSTTGYTNGATLTFIPNQNNKYFMMGLTTDPSSNTSYDTIDYAWYCHALGNTYIYENGSSKGAFGGSYFAGDVFTITYDGADVVYYKNGFAYRTVSNVGAGLKLYVDSSFYSVGDDQTRAISFGPMGSKGSDGTPGIGFYSGTYSSTSTSDTTITSRFTAIAGRAPLNGDVFTQNTSTTSLTKRYNGSTWVTPSAIISGDMLGDGGITANHIASNELSGTTITAGVVKSTDSAFIIDMNQKYISITV